MPVKRYAIQDLDVYPTLNDQSLYDIKAVKLRFTSFDIRQVPSPRR